MAYTPAGRQQDNSILSQIMKYDKSVQPAQSYTNTSQQWTPYGRMEDWESLAKGLGELGGKGLRKTYENIKEGAYKGTYDPREEGYKWAPGKLAAAGIGGSIGALLSRLKGGPKEERMDYVSRTPEQIEEEKDEEFIDELSSWGEGEDPPARLPEWAGTIPEARTTLSQMEGWDKLSPGEQDEAIRVRTQSLRLEKMDPFKYRQKYPESQQYPSAPGYKKERGPAGPPSPYADETWEQRIERETADLPGPDASRARAELARREALAGLSKINLAGLDKINAVDPQRLRRTGSGDFKGLGKPIQFKEMMNDPKFYNKWKMKMKRFLEKQFGKEAPVDLQSLTPIQQRLQQLQMKSKKPFKKGPNYPSGTYTRGTY